MIPACGQATRLSPTPCSKEIYPIGLRYSEVLGKTIPMVVSDCLLEYFAKAGISQAIFVIRNDKTDIPRYFEKRKDLPVHLDFIHKESSPGAPYTLDFAYEYVAGKITALGFPDILMRPADAFKPVIDKLVGNEALDIALGLFPIERKYSWDMVEFDQDEVRKIHVKPQDTHLTYGWTIAAWKPSFASFMHDYLAKTAVPNRELYIGHVLQAAMDDGLKAGCALFPEGACIDLGKPEDLSAVYRTPVF